MHRLEEGRSVVIKMICQAELNQNAAALFADWNESLIWSCLQGIMGRIYVDEKEKPLSAMAILGDFCFFAGRSNRELTAYKPEWCEQDFIIAVPQNEQWAKMIEECFGDRARKVVRYAIKKEPDIFDRNRLQEFVRQLPSEYSIRLIDEEMYEFCRKESWCVDFVSQFADWPMYQKMGLGVVVLKDGIPAAGASSYSVYADGIEIEIDTKPEFRRKGLATVCGARLILECLDRGLYPSWDAQNPWSVALAEKLGYHFDHEYTAYEIRGY